MGGERRARAGRAKGAGSRERRQGEAARCTAVRGDGRQAASVGRAARGSVHNPCGDAPPGELLGR